VLDLGAYCTSTRLGAERAWHESMTCVIWCFNSCVEGCWEGTSRRGRRCIGGFDICYQWNLGQVCPSQCLHPPNISLFMFALLYIYVYTMVSVHDLYDLLEVLTRFARALGP
jgi:hypothetical protein